MSLLPTGKLPLSDLTSLLSAVGPKDPSVLLGPGIGLDCAVLDLDDGRWPTLDAGLQAATRRGTR